jgi:hypothetical protein
MGYIRGNYVEGTHTQTSSYGVRILRVIGQFCLRNALLRNEPAGSQFLPSNAVPAWHYSAFESEASSCKLQHFGSKMKKIEA